MRRPSLVIAVGQNRSERAAIRRTAGSSLLNAGRLKTTLVPFGTAHNVHAVRQATGAGSFVSHQEIASISFGIATKTSQAMFPE